LSTRGNSLTLDVSMSVAEATTQFILRFAVRTHHDASAFGGFSGPPHHLLTVWRWHKPEASSSATTLAAIWGYKRRAESIAAAGRAQFLLPSPHLAGVGRPLAPKLAVLTIRRLLREDRRYPTIGEHQ
jgi:hypothetical protein